MVTLDRKEKTCCFTGHRFVLFKDYTKIKRALCEVLERLIENGIDTFISGGALGFDIMAAKMVLKAKEKHPHLQLVMAIPCSDQHMKWSLKDRCEYENVLKACDDIYCLNDKYCTGCMHQRNRFMVEKSSVCVAYFTGKSGGTAHTVGLAKEEGLMLINVAKTAN